MLGGCGRASKVYPTVDKRTERMSTVVSIPGPCSTTRIADRQAREKATAHLAQCEQR
jgi:hypothetical protein